MSLKSKTSHIYRHLQLKNLGIPETPKIVLFGSPNVDTKLFAHRIAIDINVPAISIHQIYKSLLCFEEQYSQDTFYRRVIKILKNPDVALAEAELEANSIPEKLLTLTKYSELGYVLYDYPNNEKEAKSLEAHSNGGINLALNLMFKKDIGKEREEIRYQCKNCERNYYKGKIIHQLEGTAIKGFFPEDGICIDVSVYINLSVDHMILLKLLIYKHLNKNILPMSKN